MRILIDVDGVLADLVGALCAELATRDSVVTPEDFTSYPFEDILTPQEMRIITHHMAMPGFCSSIPWYPAGRTFLECIKEAGEVVAVTKPFQASRTWAWERQQWLHGVVSHVVHTGYKECIRGDLLIEDCFDHIEAWLFENPQGRAVMIDRPWNQATRQIPRMFRAHSYGEAVYYVRGLAPPAVQKAS